MSLDSSFCSYLTRVRSGPRRPKRVEALALTRGGGRESTRKRVRVAKRVTLSQVRHTIQTKKRKKSKVDMHDAEAKIKIGMFRVPWKKKGW